jgi:excisionase family DNA binding protein
MAKEWRNSRWPSTYWSESRKGAGAVNSQTARAGFPDRLLYSVAEAADLLGIGRTFMYHLVATGEVDSLKVGTRRKIPRESIHGYIQRLRSEQLTLVQSPTESISPRTEPAEGD